MSCPLWKIMKQMHFFTQVKGFNSLITKWKTHHAEGVVITQEATNPPHAITEGETRWESTSGGTDEVLTVRDRRPIEKAVDTVKTGRANGTGDPPHPLGLLLISWRNSSPR